jgi:hypothetical protein
MEGSSAKARLPSHSIADPWRGNRVVAGSRKLDVPAQALRPPDIEKAHPRIARAVIRETTAGDRCFTGNNHSY